MKDFERLRKKLIKDSNKFKNMAIVLFTIIYAIILAIGWLSTLVDCDSECTTLSRNGLIIEAVVFILIYVIVIIFIISKEYYFKNDKDYQKLKQLFVEQAFKTALNKLFDKVEYNPDTGLSDDVIKESKIVKYPKENVNVSIEFESEDYFKGKYKKIPFEASDIQLTHTVSHYRDSSTTYTDFNGQWYIFKLDKKYRSSVIIMEKDFDSLYQVKTNIKMEKTAFNDKFNIYAEDEHLAYYILTPMFIEKLEELEEQINGSIALEFKDRELHIAIFNRYDSLEFTSLIEMDVDKEAERIKNEIQTIVEIADILNLKKD